MGNSGYREDDRNRSEREVTQTGKGGQQGFNWQERKEGERMWGPRRGIPPGGWLEYRSTMGTRRGRNARRRRIATKTTIGRRRAMPKLNRPEPAIAIATARRWVGNQKWSAETRREKGHIIREQLGSSERERLGDARRYQERHERSRQGKKTIDETETTRTNGETKRKWRRKKDDRS